MHPDFRTALNSGRHPGVDTELDLLHICSTPEVVKKRTTQFTEYLTPHLSTCMSISFHFLAPL